MTFDWCGVYKYIEILGPRYWFTPLLTPPVLGVTIKFTQSDNPSADELIQGSTDGYILWFVILVVISITIERITKKIYDNYCPDLIWRDPSRQEFLERKRECLSTLEEVYKLEERQSDISKQKIKKDIAKAVRRNVNLEDKELIINAATKAIEQFPEFDEVTAKPDRSRIARQVEGIRYENLRKKSIGVCYLCYGLIVIASVSSVCAFVILILPLVS